MARYILFHTVACLTRQQLQRLAENLAGDPEVQLLRMCASTLAGRLMAEFEAPDRETLNAWLFDRNVQAGEVFRVELEWQDGAMHRY